MEQFTGYLFTAVWAVIGIYLVYMGKKVHKFCYYISLLLFFMFGWSLADQLMTADLFSGTAAIVYRVIIALFLIVGVIIYFKKVRSSDDK
ncbi:hypothetical protein B5F08_08890 [Anaeromassilibacillus sp. An172]|uniref:hypothetical protein n=1 Tax=Anaeromassilibacillus sp. An172 TaxID=1965570 RepID=UPI000B36C695|nr:hypothetical protein [Anaeromassilibacillus sp. An172]OUP77292.1 hypothetical protein B5F08_08890 [Anaeromassilibacillus sp. An172]